MSITFSRIGRLGNLGNQLHQIAFTYALAKKHNVPFSLPRWEYAQFFEHFDEMVPQYSHVPHIDMTVKEDHFHHTPLLWDQYADSFRDKSVDLMGWVQSRKYWEEAAADIEALFEFKKEWRRDFLEKKAPPSLFWKPVIAISIRRGDYVSNPNYDLLPATYYIQALLEHFPDFRENYHLMFFSDDIDYCKLHFSCLKNAFFAEGMNAIEQLFLGSICNHAIVANSTFSWWMAVLMEFYQRAHQKPKVIRPGYIFDGPLLATHDDRDFWPEEWIRHDHKNNKINLKDVTFTIPVSYDSRDRKENFDLCLKYLQDFETNIIVGEHGVHPRFEYARQMGCQYMRFDMPAFHRTKMLNDMALAAKTEIIANWDADIIIPPMQVIEAVHRIKSKQAQMVYPYDGQFARVPRKPWYNQVMAMGDAGIFVRNDFQGMGKAPLSVGGAVLWDAEAFVDCGMENEHMISYAPEDAERYYRAKILGLKIERIDGVLYHIDHLVTKNSSIQHEHYRDNMVEYHKVKAMSKEELREYVDSWGWKKNYTPLYYESIFEESVRSRDAVFKILMEMNLLKKNDVVVDAGCGVGSWGYKMREQYDCGYAGIDFGVPVDKLVIDPCQYIDMDLRQPFPPLMQTYLKGRGDIVLCLEVGEHLEEEYVENLVDNLCIMAPIVIFSAAIPHQGGLHHHTERWQSWWAEKFAKRGYYPQYVTELRDDLRKNPDVCLWYAQNMVIYSKTTEEGVCPPMELNKLELDFIDPRMYENTLKHYHLWK